MSDVLYFAESDCGAYRLWIKALARLVYGYVIRRVAPAGLAANTPRKTSAHARLQQLADSYSLLTPIAYALLA